MRIGYRIIRPEDVGILPGSFVQISLWKTADWGVADGERAVREAVAMADSCRKIGIRTVFHPLGYPLTGEEAGASLPVFRQISAAADLGIIVHDEGEAGGARLSEPAAREYARNLRAISLLCHVSVENSFNSADSIWFWERFVAPEGERVSITLDIGHLESAGIDSISFVRSMPEHLVHRVKFVHIHRKDGARSGVVDHWPLVSGCRELAAMEALLNRMPDRNPRVILELDPEDIAGISSSIALLEELR